MLGVPVFDRLCSVTVQLVAARLHGCCVQLRAASRFPTAANHRDLACARTLESKNLIALPILSWWLSPFDQQKDISNVSHQHETFT
jgi:hypothetical protein